MKFMDKTVDGQNSGETHLGRRRGKITLKLAKCYLNSQAKGQRKQSLFLCYLQSQIIRFDSFYFSKIREEK